MSNAARSQAHDTQQREDARRVVPHAHSGSGFAAEPPEWFAGKRHRLLFRLANADVVLHVKSRACKAQYPHAVTTCGYFERTERGKMHAHEEHKAAEAAMHLRVDGA